MSDDNAIYANCIARIRNRLNLIDDVLSGRMPITNQDLLAEVIFVQFRKSLEELAFASLSANRDVYSAVHAKFSVHWRANDMLAELEKVNPGFYPVAAQAPITTQPGFKHVGRLDDGFMTRDDFAKLCEFPVSLRDSMQRSVVAFGHGPRKDSGTRRFVATEPAVRRVAQREPAAEPAAGADLGGGGGDGAAAWTSPHQQGAAHGLLAVEEAIAGWHATGSAGAARIPGVVGRAHHRTGGVCGGVGVGRRQDACDHERSGTGLGEFAARLARSGPMIQITPQMRVLVAVDAVDFRQGIDSLDQLYRDKPAADTFSGCVFVFRSRQATSIKVLVYDGMGFWLATKRLSKGRFRWWPEGETARELQAHQAQLLFAAGNPDLAAAPVWRKVS